MFGFRHRFVESHRVVAVEVEEWCCESKVVCVMEIPCNIGRDLLIEAKISASMSTKIDKIVGRSKRLANLLDHIGHNLSASASGPLLGQSLH